MGPCQRVSQGGMAGSVSPGTSP
ncbi:hypothetical protein E2C01_074935 [Portunus trituberculatus]|uniref:Uncharacterized protein n=1 Tax=Portunus trituberculatus TaxID=210409 RepID=A0A5B7IFK8_PORTR|nr:hypothetical protein [Portunus trituberculatus]